MFSSRGKHFSICDPESAIPPQIVEYLSMGQNWPEGDAAFHRRILVPTLLVHGLQDKHITLVQQCEMERVKKRFLFLFFVLVYEGVADHPEGVPRTYPKRRTHVDVRDSRTSRSHDSVFH